MTPSDRARRALLRAAPYAPSALCAAALGMVTVRSVIAHAGTPAAPLDDTYIHFQYARSIVELHPFRYTAGAAPTPGATSLLWPLLLAPFYALGLRTQSLLYAAWFMSFGALALLAVETKRAADGLVESKVAVATGAMVLGFGGYTWFAGSGMEVVPFAYLLARSARRTAEWLERGAHDDASARRHHRELVALAVLTPLMRPEGAVASLLVASALAVRPCVRRANAVPALLGIFAPSVVSLLATGQAMSSTAVAKWLPMNPYYQGERLVYAVAANIELFFGTLLDGRLWTSLFLPTGGRTIAALSLAAIPFAGFRRKKAARALAVLVLALAMMIPATYETFLVNRVRYIWPFAWAWFIGLAALIELVADAAAALLAMASVPASGMGLLGAGIAAGGFASLLPVSIEDLSTSAEAVTKQQVSLARWAEQDLGPDARIGVNDTGAMAYFGGHPTFDVVGLTTRGEARYWTAGPGSRFEHYEHLPRDGLPTHFIVYPEWFGVEPLLGEELTSRSVSHTILGGFTMGAFRARYDLLGSGAKPTTSPLRAAEPLDVLDVADIEDEAAHRYRLFDATRETDVVVSGPDRADGGRLRRRRDEFSIVLSPGGTLLARWGAEEEARVRIVVDDRPVAEQFLLPGQWQEVPVDVPSDVPRGAHDVRVVAMYGEFDSLHYWSYR